MGKKEFKNIVEQALTQGYILRVVKFIKEVTGMGLKQAKDLYDECIIKVRVTEGYSTYTLDYKKFFSQLSNMQFKHFKEYKYEIHED